MQYQFVDKPICCQRVDRLSSREKRFLRERAEKKRSEMQELFSVEQLIDMGFYESLDKPKPYGVELTTVQTEKMDADWYQMHTIESYRIVVCPPENTSVTSIKKLNPYFWSDSNSYFWKYEIYGNAMMWVSIDLLSRIFDFSCWDKVESIPLLWKIGNEKAYQKSQLLVSRINKGSFKDIPFPAIPVIDNLEEKVAISLSLRFPKSQIKVTNKAIINYLRHHWTPYDYLWETERMSRDEARQCCDAIAIQSISN